jgi:hypothetical protein
MLNTYTHIRNGAVKVRGKNSFQYWASEKQVVSFLIEGNNITNLSKTKISKLLLGCKSIIFRKNSSNNKC